MSSFYRNLFKFEKSFADCPPAKAIAVKVRQEVEAMRENIALVQSLCNPGMRDRHWVRVSEIVGREIVPTEETTLAEILSWNLAPFVEKFEPIAEAASKEYALERALTKMKAEWASMAFEPIPYRETGTAVLASVDEIQLLLDDHIVRTQTMRGSPFIKPFEEIAQNWEANIMMLQVSN